MIPALAKAKAMKLPTVADAVLDNGLRVLVVRRTGVPLVELRLRIPSAAPSGKRGPAFVARSSLLGDTMFSGTERRDAAQVARDLQAVGGQLSVGADAERIGFGGSVLASGLSGLLDVLADVLTSATYPKYDVEGERDRLAQELAIYRSNPGTVAREALLTRMYGDHPYSRELPEPEDLLGVTPGNLRTMHARRVVPDGSVLTLVGDITPARATALVAKALGTWVSGGSSAGLPAVPAQEGRRVLLVDRPGAVQTTIRFGGAAPTRTAADYQATVLANLVFGGYFSSRWVANIREDKGYTYSPHSGIDHGTAGSRFLAGADVATDVTAPAMVETLYELGRIATVPVKQDELDQARRYALGTLALGTATQAGLASQMSQLVAAGLDLSWLREHIRLMEKVTVEEVLAAAGRWLAPTVLTPVLVGDATVIEQDLRSVVDLETQ